MKKGRKLTINGMSVTIATFKNLLIFGPYPYF
jgi:hypothetical protein